MQQLGLRKTDRGLDIAYDLLGAGQHTLALIDGQRPVRLMGDIAGRRGDPSEESPAEQEDQPQDRPG